jgi:hypothetical protein
LTPALCAENTGTVLSIANANANLLRWKPDYPAARSMNALLDPAFYAQSGDSSLTD